VVGRQVAQLVFALVLARLLGPAGFGVVSAATVFVTLSMLLLDQGLSAALVQRPTLSAQAPGAAATVNVMMAAVLGVLSWVGAPALAAFFHSPPLTGLVRVLGVGLVLKALAITPRAMLSRRLDMRSIASADVTGAVIGATAGLVAAIAGAGYWALAVQVIVLDVVVAVMLLRATPGVRFNLRVSLVRPLLPFSSQVFATNGVAYLSRNIDNAAVGHVLGPAALAQYGMAYRVLVIPVQMIGQTVNRVMFPALSRMATDRARLADTLVRATEVLALAALPAMTLVACASKELVVIVLGPSWAPTAPIVAVLALAGARETVYYITPSLMKATGHASMNLRFELASTAVQVTGIIIGLRHGAFGVACGYAIAGLVLTPVLMLLQRRLSGVRLKDQLAAVAPAVNSSVWGGAAYLLVGRTDWSPLVTVTTGSLAFVAVAALVLGLLHRPAARRALLMVRDRGQRGSRRPPADVGARA